MKSGGKTRIKVILKSEFQKGEEEEDGQLCAVFHVLEGGGIIPKLS